MVIQVNPVAVAIGRNKKTIVAGVIGHRDLVTVTKVKANMRKITGRAYNIKSYKRRKRRVNGTSR